VLKSFMVQANLDTIDSGVDERIMGSRLAEEKNKSRQGKEGQVEGEEDGERQGGIRQRLAAARQALNIKKKVKKKLEEKVIAKAKTKLLNLIPGYGFWVIFQKFVTAKKIKLDIVDIMILLFINLKIFFIILAGLVILFLIIDIYQNPVESVWTYGVGPIYEIIKALFKS